MNSLNRTKRSALALLLFSFLIASSTTVAAKAARLSKRNNVKARSAQVKKGRAEAKRLASRRRAEAARLAAAARERAAEDQMRQRVQDLIAKDETRGEDPEIRRIALDALGDHAGTVVVMDPQTGRIYTIVNQQWAARETFKPCSTIKLVTSVAGVSEEVIDPTNTAAISDSNRVTLTQALAHSKNPYFQQVGAQVGLVKMISYARQLGLGEKTGINFRNESAGRLPALRANSDISRVFSHGDGFKITALQLVTLASAFANHGRIVVPFIPRTGIQASANVRAIHVDAQTWETIRPGMVGSVRYGSGRKAYDPFATIAGKTGTCIDNGQWVGLFTSYAPLNNPKLAIVVIAKGADGRNHFPAAVAGRIYRELNGRFFPNGDGQLTASSKDNVRDDNGDAGENDEEEESDGANAKASLPEPAPAEANKTLWGTDRISPDRKVKATVMPVGRRRVTQ